MFTYCRVIFHKHVHGKRFFASTGPQRPAFFSSTNLLRNPAPKLFLASSLALFTYYQYRQYRRDLPPGVTPLRHIIYTTIPTNVITRIASYISSIDLPSSMRHLVIGSYARMFGCNLEEAEKPLGEYNTLGEFFARRLKSGIRPISRDGLVSPVDGELLHLGTIHTMDTANASSEHDFTLEQIKGVKYSLKALCGGHEVFKPRGNSSNPNGLFYATIYLSPGSYHRFHAPTSFRLSHSQSIKGELLPIAPWMMKIAPGLVSLNQRHLLLGQWAYGLMAMVPVGATNVGTILIDRLPSEYIKKGEEVGHFRMGSSIVMVFEAPEGFEWTAKVGERIKMGQSLGRIKHKSYWSWMLGQ